MMEEETGERMVPRNEEARLPDATRVARWKEKVKEDLRGIQDKDTLQQKAVKLAVGQAKLEWDSMRDPVSGALSRIATKELYVQWMEEEEMHQTGQGISVVQIDADNFSAVAKLPPEIKQDPEMVPTRLKHDERVDGAVKELIVMFADIQTGKYREQLGDEAQGKVSKVLGKARIGRLGGEELVVLVPGSSGRELVEAMDIVRKTYEKQFVNREKVSKLYGELGIWKQTISVGVAIAGTHEPWDGVMARGDAALSEAKKKGKNRVELIEERRAGEPRVGAKEFVVLSDENDRLDRIDNLSARKQSDMEILLKLSGEEKERKIEEIAQNEAWKLEGLEELGLRDPLTGALNKRAGRLYLNQALQKEAGVHTCGVMIVDIRNFKAINDENNHDTGDVVLRGQVQSIEKAVLELGLKGVKIVRSRPGGEYWVIVEHLPLDQESAQAELAKLSSELGDNPVIYANKMGEDVSVSTHRAWVLAGSGESVQGVEERLNRELVKAKR